MMATQKIWWSKVLVVCAVVGSVETFAATICDIDRQGRTEAMTSFIHSGDVFANKDQHAKAILAYLRVFNSFMYKGENYTYRRCTRQQPYQEAADKLRVVVKPYAKNLMAKGHYLWDEYPREEAHLISGALYLLLSSNLYDAFIEHSIDYAKRELRERDIDTRLVNMIDHRLKQLKNTTRAGGVTGYTDDTLPLLDEELAAFEKLAGFQHRLQAQLKPLYPRITDYWLAEETKRHTQLLALDNSLRQSLLVNRASGAIGSGLSRMSKHTNEVQRLKDRANQRGESFMSQNKFVLARAYFKVADNNELWVQADSRARKNEQDQLSRLKDNVQADIKKMRKTGEEKSAFEDAANNMAEEFGFDVED